MPTSFIVEIEYKEHAYAKRKSFYPGVVQVGSHVIRFETDDYFEVLRMMAFIL
ncbi:M55 family metallopeptidase [Fusibacter bizertensis]